MRQFSSFFKTARTFSFVFAAGCFSVSASPAAEARYQVGPVPAWVEELKVPDRDPGEFGKSSSSMHYLLVDEQAEAGLSESYYHYAYEVLSESGLDGASEISVSFDPSYEKITFHQIRRLRQGEWKDLLPGAKIQMLQREKEMEYQLLDGSLTAVCHLEDVRVGDILEYSFSRQGAHPLLQGHFCDTNSLAWSIPVQELHVRVVVPLKQAVKPRLFLDSGPVKVEEAGENKIYRITRKNVPAILSEADAPSWHDQYAWVQWSDFSDWKEVVDWALPFYGPQEKLSSELQVEVDRIAAHNQDSESRIKETLQFVQSQIRYLGLEMGAGSYRPNPPDLVLSRRFGDCKDKTLLLVTMLKALGVEAYPALVHTNNRDAIKDRLPSPYNFDHVITRVTLPGNEELWIDPTRRVQYGKLKELYVGNYGKALVLQAGNAGLSNMGPRKESFPRMEVRENFKVGKLGEPSFFKIRTIYRGQLAESNRNYFAERTRLEAHKECVDYYAKIYPSIRAKDQIHIQDDKENNVLDVLEEYEIKDFWKKEKDGSWSAGFYPYQVEDKLVETGQLDRKTPLQLIYPVRVAFHTEVEMFENWNLTPENVARKNEFFVYDHKATVARNLISFDYDYENLKEEVPVARIAAYNKALIEVKESLGYTLTYDAGALQNHLPGEKELLKWVIVGVGAAVIIAILASTAAFLWIILRKDRPSRKTGR